MSLQDEGPYSAAWLAYRRCSRAFWIVFVLYLPGLLLVSTALRHMPGGGTVIFVAVSVWMIAVTVIGNRKWSFRCPRCDQLFFQKVDDRPWRRLSQHNPFARCCMHCHLPKWAAHDPNSPAIA